MSENTHCIMDETGRPIEPWDPEYEVYLKTRSTIEDTFKEAIEKIGLPENDFVKQASK